MSFQAPTYTQAPNDFFDMVKDMTDAELRVTTVMIRQTFGFHRLDFKMSIKELAEQAGLSEQGARDGAEAAEKRGTFKRTNPDTKKTAEWNLNVVDLNVVDLQPVEVEPQPSRGLTPTQLTTGTVLKKEKEIRKKKDYLDLLAEIDGSEGNQKALRVAEMYDRMDRGFRTSFTRNKNTDVVVKFIIQQEAKGDSLDKFVSWANRDEFNASRIWEYAENPIKIKTRWQVAMSDQSGYKGAIEGV
jgi:DNA-binding Lrp family transcriptional regulator